MKSCSVRLPSEIFEKTAQMKKKTGVAESVILRHAVAAGLPHVEQALAGLKNFACDVAGCATVDYKQEESK